MWISLIYKKLVFIFILVINNLTWLYFAQAIVNCH